jgi:YecR-like lipoprotein
MDRSSRHSLLAALTLLTLAGCATPDKWNSTGGNRELGLVRLSYEYPEYQQPEMSEAEADTLALNRCHAWGYEKVEPIAGQVRRCANMDEGNCNLWSVTREYQCKSSPGRESGYASRLSR